MSRFSLLTLMVTALASGRARSDPGREFYAVYSYYIYNTSPLSILACNPDLVATANVVVETEDGIVGGKPIPAGGCEVVLVSDLRKAPTTLEDQLAYRVRSDLPVFAQQFTNFEFTARVPSATRLPDRGELGTDYMILAMRAGANAVEPSVLVVIAPEPARVSVTVTADRSVAGECPRWLLGAPTPPIYLRSVCSSWRVCRTRISPGA